MVTRVVAAILAAVAAVTGFLPLHALYTLAGQGWLAWVITIGLDAIVAAAITTLFTRRRAWSAWATVVASIPVNLAAPAVGVHPWLAFLIAPWPVVAVALGCITSVRSVPERLPEDTR